MLVDAGDIVVHIMQPAVRAYYNLEELWAPPAVKRPHEGRRSRRGLSRSATTFSRTSVTVSPR